MKEVEEGRWMEEDEKHKNEQTSERRVVMARDRADEGLAYASQFSLPGAISCSLPSSLFTLHNL